MAAPQLIVECAFATDVTSTTPAWKDITGDVIAVRCRRGRQFELDRVEAGTATIKLDNNSRAYDPTNTASPYYPNVLPMRRIRLRARPNLVTNPGFETDLTGWTTFSTGTSANRITTDAAVGTASLELVFNGASVNWGRALTLSGLVPGQQYTLSGYIKRTAAVGNINIDLFETAVIDLNGIAVATGTGTGGAWTRYSETFTYPVGGSGTVQVRVFGDGTPAGSARFDGIQLETGSTLTTYTDATKYLFTGYVERWPQSWERADYAYVDIQAVDGFELLANAYVTSSFPIQQTGARVAAVLDTVSWPAADRSISTGRSQIQASTFTAGSPASALEHIQSVVESELGLFFMDGEGDAVFQDRLYRGTTSTSTTSQATFGDQGAELEYTELRPTMDKQLIVNEAIVSPQGGTAQTWTDSTSQTRYFRRSRSRSSLVEDDNEALSLAQYLIWNYKDPSLRFDQLSFQPLDDDTLFTQALDRRISDRITVKRRPPGGGPVMSLDSFIESIDYSISASHIWTITWQLSPILPANTATYFQLDVSTLDGTHVLAY